MPQLSALEVVAIVKEIREKLPCKIINIYQHNNIFNIKLRCKNEKKNLLLEPAERVHFSEIVYEWEATKVAMILRQHIRNRFIEDVKQINFDRIIEFDVSGGYKLIVELLSRGNLILLKEEKIIFSTKYVDMKDRSIKPGLPYTPPPSERINPITAKLSELINYLKKFDMPIKGLIKLGIGKKYALDILNSLDLEEDAVTKNLTDEIWIKLANTLKALINRVIYDEIQPCVYYRDGDIIDFSLFPLSQYTQLKCKYKQNFSEALDSFYSVKGVSDYSLDELEEEIKKLEKRIKKQQQLINSYIEKSKKYRMLGEKLYENITELESLLSIIRHARKELNLSWNDIALKIEEGKAKGIKEALFVDKIDKSGRIIVNLEGYRVELNINTQISKLAEEYYEKAKKIEHKISRAKEELRKSEEELKKLLAGQRIEKEKTKIIIKQPTTRWYHKFRWFISSTGHLIIAGKDAETNEMIVKDYMNENDVFLHAEIHGGAVTVIKNGRENINQELLKEAAIFAASYSSAWKKGLAAVDVFWCYPEDVSVKPPSGLYLPKGSFIIKRKNFLKNTPLEIAIGILIKKIDEMNYTFELITGPTNAVKKQTDLYVVLIPGNLSKSEVAKMIKKELLKGIKENNLVARKIIEKLDINKIIELLPGPSNLKRS